MAFYVWNEKAEKIAEPKLRITVSTTNITQKIFCFYFHIAHFTLFFKDFYKRSKIPCSLQVTSLPPTTLFYIPVSH